MKHQIQIYFIAIVSSFMLFCAAAMALPAGSDIDYSAYMQMAQHRIKKNWHPPAMRESTRAVVSFKVTKMGKIIDARIIQPSFFSKTDQAALDAVNSASPLPPPPGSDDVSIHFTFDYNITKQHPNKLADLSGIFAGINSEALGFVVGVLIVLALVIYKLGSLGKPPRDGTLR